MFCWTASSIWTDSLINIGTGFDTICALCASNKFQFNQSEHLIMMLMFVYQYV